MRGRSAVESGWLECVTWPNRTTLSACVCSCRHWLTRSQRTRRPVQAFRIVGLWIADVYFHSTNRTDHDHSSVCDVPALHGFRQLFEIRRSRHRTYMLLFSLYVYSSHHFNERCDVWNRSSPWYIRSAWVIHSSPPPVYHSRCKATHIHPFHLVCISESSWIDHTSPRSCIQIKATEWFRKH